MSARLMPGTSHPLMVLVAHRREHVAVQSSTPSPEKKLPKSALSAERLAFSCEVLRERSDRGPRQLQRPSWAASVFLTVCEAQPVPSCAGPQLRGQRPRAIEG